tara:strand:+ start:71 stop:316 length:246 start_codon:yes stop_codon:yes gene_type:complete
MSKQIFIDCCKSCDEPFDASETERFIYSLDLPSNVKREARRVEKKLCVPCLQDYITDEFGIKFLTIYEILLQEKTIIWSDD